MWRYYRSDWNFCKTYTFHKQRNDTLVLISRRIKDFFLKHSPSGFNLDNAKITQLAQECMKKSYLIVKYN